LKRVTWMMQILRVVLVTLVLVGSLGRTAAAEPTPEWVEGEAGVDEAFNRGIALRRSGNDEAALAVFLDLEKRDPDSVRLLLHISTAALAAGKWLMAYDYLQKAGAHKDDPYYQRHLAAIDNVSRTIAERVGQFRARGTPAGAEVRLNGDLIGTLPMTTGKPLEIGTYMLEVTSPGYFSLRRPITIAGHGVLTQEAIDLRQENPMAVPAGPALVDSQPASVADRESVQTGWRARWITWTLAGAAVVAGATSGVAFAIREDKANRWNDNSVNSACLSQANPQLTRGDVCANTRHDISVAQAVGTGAGIAAGGLAVAAIAHWVATTTHWGRSGEGGTSAAAAASDRGTAGTGKGSGVACAPGLASLACWGSF